MQVWDLAMQECSATLQHHSGKVQAVAWNPEQGSVLLSGSFDKSACLVSCWTARWASDEHPWLVSDSAAGGQPWLHHSLPMWSSRGKASSHREAWTRSSGSSWCWASSSSSLTLWDSTRKPRLLQACSV